MKLIRKQYTLSFAILLFAMTSIAGDWVQWWHKTPGNNEISNQSFNDVNRNLLTCNEAGQPLLQFIERWYFYKGYVIGSLEPNQTNKFFIINEQTCTLDTLNNNVEFDQYLSQKRLKPMLWTRWYNSNWGFFFVGTGYGGPWDFLWFRGTWMLFPLAPVAIAWFILNYSKRNIKWLIGLAFILFMIFRIILDFYPESI